MTQIPNYIGRDPSPGPVRPTSITVLAFAGLLVSVMLILCNTVSMVSMVVGNLADSNEVMAAVQQDTLLHRWSIASTVVRLLLGIVLLIGVMGALGLKRWGLWMVLAYAGLTLLLSFADTYLTVTRLVPLVLASTNPLVQEMAARRHIGIPARVILECAYPVLVLALWTRPRIRAAFTAGGVKSAPVQG